ncbi:hypothetical protein BU26DRAFT_167876 [Trematosphaeria pertusa]|uniref:Uncharacterized protein n=1 Tax=Trematosphaeria pertusa TaxID=390896 RepID=A0A6A6HVU7_9PLEO|nr:uncharacterized protein BU26DRAFT_167876 [Trematosphaeria pertusa]KAF2242177.1 hypothetical protein BU26DRAFT_167876 [Trematosphaeria pertusa]
MSFLSSILSNATAEAKHEASFASCTHKARAGNIQNPAPPSSLEASYIMVPRPPTETELDAEYDMISPAEADEYCDARRLRQETGEDRIHNEWLGRYLVRKKDRIVVELGPHTIYKEFRIETIPPTSKLLVALGKRPPFHRHVWIPEIDEQMFRSYSFLQDADAMAVTGSWIDAFKLWVTAKLLEDEAVEKQALSSIWRKAQLGQYKLDRMFSPEEVDWVFGHTGKGTALRKTVVGITVRSEGLVSRLKGPAEFVKEVEGYLQVLGGHEVVDMRKGVEDVWPGMSLDEHDLPKIWQLSPFEGAIPAPAPKLPRSSPSKQGLATPKSPSLPQQACPVPTRATSTLKPAVPPSIPLPRHTPLSSSSLQQSTTPKSSSNPSNLAPPTSRIPMATHQVVPRIQSRVAVQHLENISRDIPSMLVSKPPLPSPRQSRFVATRSPIPGVNQGKSRQPLKYANSVLCGKFNSQPGKGALPSVDIKEQPVRQPINPPNVELLVKNMGVNFAARRRDEWCEQGKRHSGGLSGGYRAS